MRWLGLFAVTLVLGCGESSEDPGIASGGSGGVGGTAGGGGTGAAGGSAGLAGSSGVGGGGGDDAGVADSATEALPPAFCPAGAHYYEQLGLVHAPAPGTEYKRVTFEPPAGEYGEVRLKLEVFAPAWNDATSAMRHMLFWFARDGKHFDLFAYASLVATKSVLLRHGIGIEAGAKPKLTANAALPMPETYHVFYRYDMAGGVAELDITRGTPPAPVANLVDVPNVQSIVIGQNGSVDVDLGNQGPNDPYPNPQEPPQYGWTFSDLQVCVIPL